MCAQVASRSGFLNETLDNYVKLKTFAPRAYHGLVDHGGFLWVLGGAHRRNWPNIAPSEDDDCSSDGSGGYECPLTEAFNDIWKTTTLTTDETSPGEFMVQWTYVETNSDDIWEARYQHAVVSFQDHIWVIGGGTVLGTLKNDLWKSTSGDQWEKVGDQNTCTDENYPEEDDPDRIGCLPPRRGHAATVNPMGDKILIFGGLHKKGNTDIFLNDVWETSLDANGECESMLRCFRLVRRTNKWPGRYLHTGLVYQESLWVIGGQYCGDAVDTCRENGCQDTNPAPVGNVLTSYLSSLVIRAGQDRLPACVAMSLLIR